MARSTGPILAAGAITMANQSLLNGQPVNIRVALATGAAAGMLGLLEQPLPDFAVAVAWLALATVLLVRVDPKNPSPVESFARWWQEGK
jgi:hypothetical protein